jgi:hypothetical protein
LRTVTTLLIALTAHASADERFPSPNRQFEAYATANYADGSGMKLFVRRTRLDRKGVLLFPINVGSTLNGPQIHNFWPSPIMRMAHIADAYVFGILAGDGQHLRTVLYYHTPKPFTYNVKWDVAVWLLRERSIVLTKEVRDQETHTTARTQMIARIGTKSLVLNQSILR